MTGHALVRWRWTRRAISGCRQSRSPLPLLGLKPLKRPLQAVGGGASCVSTRLQSAPPRRPYQHKESRIAAEDRGGMSVNFTCKDMATSVSFYRDKLGFTMKERWPDESAPMWCNMILGSRSVMLGAAMEPGAVEAKCAEDPGPHRSTARWPSASSANAAGVGVIVYLMVDDIDAYNAEIRRKGVEPRMEPKTPSSTTPTATACRSAHPSRRPPASPAAGRWPTRRRGRCTASAAPTTRAS